MRRPNPDVLKEEVRRIKVERTRDPEAAGADYQNGMRLIETNFERAKFALEHHYQTGWFRKKPRVDVIYLDDDGNMIYR